MSRRFLLLLHRRNYELFLDQQLVDSQEFNESNETVEELAARVRESLSNAGFRNEPLSLAIGAGHVFCLSTQLESKIVAQPKALKYAIEDSLPFDAEQMAVAVVSSDPSQFIVAVDSSLISSLTARLNSEYGVLIRNIVAATPRLVEHLIETAAIEKSCRLLIFNDGHVEIMEVRNGILFLWKQMSDRRFFQSNPRSFLEQPDGFPCYFIGCAKESLEAIVSNGFTHDMMHSIPGSYGELIASSVGSLRKGRHDTRFDFASQMEMKSNWVNSVSKAWERLACAVLVLILCLAAGFGYQAFRWNASVGQIDSQLQQSYRELFPGSRINGPIEKMLENQLARLQKENQLVEYANRSALLLHNLKNLLEALPNEYRFDHIRIVPIGIVLDGEVETLPQLDDLRRKLESAGFEIQPGSYSTDFSLTLLARSDKLEQGGRP